MDLGRLRFFLGEVLANFTRNAGMQFTAIGTVAVTIVLLGAFLFVRETIQTFGNGVLSQIEIAVYLKDDVDDAKAHDLASKFAADKAAAVKLATDPIGPLPKGLDPADLAAWTVVGNVLLNLDETLMKAKRWPLSSSSGQGFMCNSTSLGL